MHACGLVSCCWSGLYENTYLLYKNQSKVSRRCMNQRVSRCNYGKDHPRILLPAPRPLSIPSFRWLKYMTFLVAPDVGETPRAASSNTMHAYLHCRYVGYLDTRRPSTPTPYIRCYPLHQRFLAVGDTGQKHGFNMRTRKPCYWTLIYPAFLICGKTENARCAPMAQCQRATDLLTTIRFASLRL